MRNFGYINGQLCAGRMPLADIAARFGTPCYVYSRAGIESAWRAYDLAFGEHPHLVCYAVKANGNLAVLDALACLHAGFDIVSAGELALVLEAGGDPQSTVFSGVGKRTDEMRTALEAGIGCFNVESASELERLAAVAAQAGRRAPVALRVNPDVDPGTHPYIATGLRESKFGVSFDDAESLYTRALSLPSLEITGIACHIGSQVLELGPYLGAMDRMLELASRLRARGIALHHLDMGGGLGIRYREETPPRPAELVAALCKRLGSARLELRIEPGRSIVGDAGVLLTRVEYLKQNGARRFAVVDAAMNDLLRPALYGAWQEVVPVRPRDSAPARRYDIVGPVCENADFLARDRELALAEGDLLAVLGSGAYSACMASSYNARPRVAEVMVDDEAAFEVRRRGTLADLLAGQNHLPG
jgi:diaminopimelate decarboxylase